MLGVLCIEVAENALTSRDDGLGSSHMYVGQCHQPEPEAAVLMVVLRGSTRVSRTLDDLAIRPSSGPQAEDLYELITERQTGGSLILTSNREPNLV